MAYCAVVAIIVTRRPKWLGWFVWLEVDSPVELFVSEFDQYFHFYGVGLGYGGTLGYSEVVLMALVLLRWQIIFSTLLAEIFPFWPC